MADPIRGVLRQPFAQQVAFFRGKLGTLIPTTSWRDVMRQAHDRGFMVAGAQSADLLQGLAMAVDRAVSEGVGIDTFRRDFQALVQRTGWSYTGEFNWRTRTIYRTNMATSYAAGRHAQLREGGFSHWMYRHGGSSDPRPQHLAWDGLVLPADHAFWQTHFPPNGWNCSCRVVGLRRPEDARQLGGDPDKVLPEDWDAINPATGAPVGIGEGWDYAPGRSVAETVQQMAAKTQQWDYTLAKAYMQGVPEATRDALARAYRDLPSVASATRLYAQRILEGRTQLEIPQYHTLGLLTAEQAAAVRAATGVGVEGYDFALDRSSVGHVRGHHGGAAEALRGQFPIDAADYANLPRMLVDPQITGASAGGVRAIQIDATVGGRAYSAVFEVRTKRRMLALVTFWARRP